MLAKFEVKNFKNFHTLFSFDLTNTKNYEFSTEGVVNGIVNKALIYGHNGTGKSNLGFAIFDLISHLTDKNLKRHLYSNYLYAGQDVQLAEFSFEFRFGEDIVVYKYGKKNIEELVFETLSINESIVVHLDRRKESVAEISLKGTENLEKDLGESNVSVISYISKNSVLKKSKEKDLFERFISFVNGMLFFRSLESNNYIGLEQGSRKIGSYIINEGKLDDFESFLNEAGVKCKLSVIEDSEDSKTIAFDFDGKKVAFYEIASMGTRSLSLFYYWLLRLQKDNKVSLVFIDEFDAFYHHSLAKLVVKKLREIKTQVIITTHNTGIMSNDILRPDCYFLMGNQKVSSLSECTEKELRSAHNIEKMYKAGAFNV